MRPRGRPGHSFSFFFQAEDGIRYLYVLEFRRVLFRSPLKLSTTTPAAADRGGQLERRPQRRREQQRRHEAAAQEARSEERRVGKEWRERGAARHFMQKEKDNA